ncbi:MAG: FAD-dependent oxidoreductase [Phycisphaerae bacterium]|nr:FAD-dependent oxidoreductase [Phycisphaerae bacterium]
MANSRDDYDVAVIGAGPSGIAAACVAAESGRRVALLESTLSPGGPIWRSRSGPIPRVAHRWLDRLENSSVSVFDRTTAFAAPDRRLLLAEHPDGVMEIGCEKLILATGVQELFLPFPGWTLPNVTGAGALQALSKSGWPIEGKRVVVAGSGPLLIAAASYLRRHGAKIVCIAEQAGMMKLAKFTLALTYLAPSKLIQAVGLQRDLFGVRYKTGCWPVAAHGEDCVESVTLSNGKSEWTQECDYLACAFRLIPNLQWPGLLRCRIEHGQVQVDSLQETSISGVFCAGDATGIAGSDAALIEGRIAGHAAGGQPEKAKRLFAARRRTRRFAEGMARAFALRDELKGLAAEDTIVCRCEDVTHGRIAEHDTLRSAKLQTRCGMGPCQGRTCLGSLQLLYGWTNDSARPPVLPTRVESLSG